MSSKAHFENEVLNTSPAYSISPEHGGSLKIPLAVKYTRTFCIPTAAHNIKLDVSYNCLQPALLSLLVGKLTNPTSFFHGLDTRLFHDLDCFMEV